MWMTISASLMPPSNYSRGLPDRGLIIDLRDNPGGFIWAAERMLQLFTPSQVTPTKFALRATPLTTEMAAALSTRASSGRGRIPSPAHHLQVSLTLLTCQSPRSNNATISGNIMEDPL